MPLLRWRVALMEDARQLLDGLGIAGLLDAVKLHAQLVDVPEHRLGHCHERGPLGTLDVHFDDQALAGIAVSRDLGLERVEQAAFFSRTGRSDALLVEHRGRALAPLWPLHVEAVVLVHRQLQSRRQGATPGIGGGDPVRVEGSGTRGEVSADQVVTWLS